MTSKEKLALIKETWYDVDLTDEKYIDFDEEQTFKDLEKGLEVLDILKEFLSDGNTGTGWIEININPNHDVLDSEEHKKKQLLIKEWLENGKNNL